MHFSPAIVVLLAVRTSKGGQSSVSMMVKCTALSPSFETLIKPIYALLRNKSKGVKFHWSKEADLCLQQLKKRISKSPFISFADPNLPYTLTTDASAEGAAGVLMQVQNGRFKIIAAVLC